MDKFERAVFAGGCFWCIEAQFQRVKGVTKVISGYAGGALDDPKYQQVKKGDTGHYEVVEVTFEPDIISFEKLLDIFFVIHDPTQEDGQGEDIGTQYLSAVFYLNNQQKEQAIQKIQELTKENMKIATKVLPLQKLYPAEEYHQNYWNIRGKQNPYCNIIPGKIAKLRKYFKDLCTQTE